MATSSKSKSKSYSRRSIGAVLLVGVLSGITVGGGVGVFAASSTKTVTVCVDKKDNHMNYSKDSKCKSHQFKVVLNQKGVAGAKGETGAAGAKGDTGAAGTNGTNGANGAAGGSAITQQSVCDGTDLDTTANELCKIGMTGPAGGHIFFVDYNDEYTGFDYLEAAPQSCEASKTWSSDTTHSKFVLSGWALRALNAFGSGQANTTAMMTSSGSYVADTSGAAFYSDSLTCGGESDWFLGSLDEMMLMYNNLPGVGNFANDTYWTSSEEAFGTPNVAPVVQFPGGKSIWTKSSTKPVRPVRAF